MGGKNNSLGEMYSELTSKCVKVPNGIATTAEAYRLSLRSTGLYEKSRALLSDLDYRLLDCAIHSAAWL